MTKQRKREKNDNGKGRNGRIKTRNGKKQKFYDKNKSNHTEEIKGIGKDKVNKSKEGTGEEEKEERSK